jgi:hypothetical protein
MSQSRDGEQVQLPDLGPGSVDTQQFFPTARAPQVNNNPFSPGDASVTIDEEGLHVRDGAIFIDDISGNSVLSAAGFRGAWLDFIATGVYNGTFAAGAGQNALKPSRVEVTSELDLPYWDVMRAGGATSANSKVYHGSSDAADYLMEARFWVENAPLDSYMGIQQLVPFSHAFSNRGVPDGGVTVEVPTRAVDANNNYLLSLMVQQYGFDPLENILIGLGSVFEGQAVFGGALNTTISGLNPLTTHLLIEVRVTRVGLGDNTVGEVAILNSRIVPSQRSVLIEGLGTAGKVARFRTSAASSDVQLLEIDPSLNGADNKKATQLYGDLTLVRGSTGPLVLEVQGPLDAASSATMRFRGPSDAQARVDLGYDVNGTPRLQMGAGSAVPDVQLARFTPGVISVTGSMIGIGTLEAQNIEVRSNGGTPFIDFSNDLGDFDARLMLGGDDSLEVHSANFYITGSGTLLMGTGHIRKANTADGYTPALYDGDNNISFKWDGALRVRIDGTEFTITIT